jgi:hypothetical protein
VGWAQPPLVPRSVMQGRGSHSFGRVPGDSDELLDA